MLAMDTTGPLKYDDLLGHGYKLLDKKQRIKNIVTRIHWFYWTVFETTKTNGKILQSKDVQGGQGLFVYDGS